MPVKLISNLTGERAKLIPAYSDVVVYAEDIPQNILDNNFNIKYICKVFINDQLVVELKAPPNSRINNKALFRIQDVLQDFTNTDISGYYPDDAENASTSAGGTFATNAHSIHQIDNFARNKENLNNCFCLGGFESSTTVNGAIVQSMSIYSDVVFKFWNGVIQLKEGFNSYDFSNYFLTANTKNFLSLFPNNFGTTGQKIQLGQYHTLAFFHGKILGVDDALNIDVAKIQIRTFNSSDVQVALQEVDNTNANGGSTDSSTSDGRGLLYFGCGTSQLVQHGLDLSTVAYYTVTAVGGGVSISQSYRFDIVGADCKGFETIRLAFMNSLGTYDYFNFTKKSTRTTELVKSPIKTNYGTELVFSATDVFIDNFDLPIYTQGTQSGGTRNYNTNAIETIEANTDFISQEEAAILKDLFKSPSVFMQEGTTFVPVVINETEYMLQTTVNDKVIQYIIQIEKGHNTRVQRL